MKTGNIPRSVQMQNAEHPAQDIGYVSAVHPVQDIGYVSAVHPDRRNHKGRHPFPQHTKTSVRENEAQLSEKGLFATIRMHFNQFNSADNSIIFQLKKGNTQGKQLHRCVIGVGSIFGNPDLLLIAIQLYYIQRVIRWSGAAQ